MDRRHFFQGIVGGSILSALPARASGSGESKFIFIFCPGGWDTTRVFAPEFDNSNVDLEADSMRVDYGELKYVSNPLRPNVDSFFTQHAQDLLIVNGLQVRSIAHEVCTLLALSGSTSGRDPDWATLLAYNSQHTYPIPHLVLSGPALAGSYAEYIARTGSNSQLDYLLSGDLSNISDMQSNPLQVESQRLVDSYISARANGRFRSSGMGLDAELASSFITAHESAEQLKEHRRRIQFSTSNLISSQIEVALDVLRMDFSRCVTMAFTGQGNGWDSHADNDNTQTQLFDTLFEGLLQLKNSLNQTMDQYGNPLSDNTHVIVCSEMGRTPQLNATLGKDHWPYTSMLMWGPKLRTGLSIGGYDEYFQGQRLDFSDGSLNENGKLLNVESIGATLLSLADIDPTIYLSDAPVMNGILL